MSSSSWKKYGGIPHNHSTHSEYIKAGHFSMKEPYDGTFNISGVLHTTGDIVATHDISVGQELNASGINVTHTIRTRQLITEELELTDLDVKGVARFRAGDEDASLVYLYASGGKMQLTHDPLTAPAFALDIQTQNADGFRASTTASSIRNHLAETGNHRGMVVQANDAECVIEMYGGASMETADPPTVQLQADSSGGVFSTADTDTLVFRAGGVHIQPASTPLGVRAMPENGETMMVSDASLGIFAPGQYSDPATYGRAIGFSSFSPSTHLSLLQWANGFAMGGGGSVDFTMGKWTADEWRPLATISSGAHKYKHASTLGINTFSPSTEDCVLDINGPVRIGDGYAAQISAEAFAFMGRTAERSNVPLFVGKSDSYQYSLDSGQTWTQVIIDDLSLKAGVQVNSSVFAFLGENQTQNLIYLRSSLAAVSLSGTHGYSKESTGDWVDIQATYSADASSYICTMSPTKLFRYTYVPTALNNTPDDGGVLELSGDSYSKMAILGNYIWVAGPDVRRVDFTAFPAPIFAPSTIFASSSVLADIDAYQTTMCAVGGNGKVVYSTNATATSPDVGVTTIGENIDFNCVYLVNATTALIGGSNGVIYYNTSPDFDTWAEFELASYIRSGNSSLYSSIQSILGIRMADTHTLILHARVGETEQALFYFWVPLFLNRMTHSTMDVQGGIVVDGYADVSGEINVVGEIGVDGAIRVSGVVGVDGTLDASISNIQTLNVSETTTLSGETWVYGPTQVEGDIGLAGQLDASSGIFMDLSVTGDASLNTAYVQNGMVVHGNSQMTGLWILSDLVVDGSLTITGPVITQTDVTNRDLTVTRNTFLNDVSISGTLDVSGRANFESDVWMEKNVHVQNAWTASGATVENQLDVCGLALFTDISVQGLLTASGAMVENRLNVGGLSTFTDISVQDLLTASGAMVENRLEVGGVATFSEGVSMARTLDVNGYSNFKGAKFNGAVIVTNDVSLQKVVTASGAIILNNMDVCGLALFADVSIQRVLNVSGTNIQNQLDVGGLARFTDISVQDLLTASGATIENQLEVGGLALFTDISVQDLLTASGATIENQLEVGGLALFTDISVQDLLTASGATIENRLNVGGLALFTDISVQELLTASGVIIENQLEVGGLALFADISVQELTASGAIIQNQLEVGGLALFTDISVQELLTASGVIIENQLEVGGLATFASLDVNGWAQFADVSISSNLEVDGYSSFEGAQFSGAVNMVNDVSIQRVVNASGAIIWNNMDVCGLALFTDISVQDLLTASGAIIRNQLDVCGLALFTDISVQDLLTASGAIIQNDLEVDGFSNLKGVQMDGSLGVTGLLDVCGSAQFWADARIRGVLTASGAVVENQLDVCGLALFTDVSIQRELTTSNLAVGMENESLWRTTIALGICTMDISAIATSTNTRLDVKTYTGLGEMKTFSVNSDTVLLNGRHLTGLLYPTTRSFSVKITHNYSVSPSKMELYRNPVYARYLVDFDDTSSPIRRFSAGVFGIYIANAWFEDNPDISLNDLVASANGIFSTPLNQQNILIISAPVTTIESSGYILTFGCTKTLNPTIFTDLGSTGFIDIIFSIPWI